MSGLGISARRLCAHVGTVAAGTLLALSTIWIASVDGPRKVAHFFQASVQAASTDTKEPVSLAAGKFHKALQHRLNFPGIANPKLRRASDVDLEDDEVVFGVVVDGTAFAFVRGDFLDPTKHIVNLNANRRPFSVTYCDLVDCVRVLSSDEESDDTLDLNVGGLDVDSQMVLLHEGVRYGQSSPDLPLLDLAHEVTTFGAWRDRYPDTQVYSRTAIN